MSFRRLCYGLLTFAQPALPFLLGSSLWAASKTGRAQQVASLVASSTIVQRGSLGFQFVDVASGDVLADLNPSRFFAPASNTKLYTTALALVRLGPNYTFQTELRTWGAWHAGQVTVSGLQLVGGGDPNLSGRVFPYWVHAVDTDPLAALKELASKLAAAGIRQVDGDVVGVSTRYAGDLYPDGWTVDDTTYSYGAPVSALALNDNAVSVSVWPTSEGELADVALEPCTDHLILLNEIVTIGSNKTDIHVSRLRDSSEIILWGTIGSNADTWRQDVAVDDPALFAAEALIDALREQGITVRGIARSKYGSPYDSPKYDDSHSNLPQPTVPGTVLAVHNSVPLSQEIQVVNKVSQNLHAEMLLREVARRLNGSGTLQAGLDARNAFLDQIGITRDPWGVALEDGSGLARQDLTTPQSTVALLRSMWQRPERDVWLESLPIGGVDGSLEHRFRKVPGAARVHAKTGSYAHVNTLSGYIETDRHRWLAFSIMVNATAGPDSEVRGFIDHLCALFLNE